MKKKAPLKLLQALQPITDKNLDLIIPIYDEKSILHLTDKDAESDFYFKVTETAQQPGVERFIIEYKPDSIRSTRKISIALEIEGVVDRLKGWLQLISNYNGIKTIYDDPIVKKYQEDFYKKIEIIDEDADKVSFNLEQQIFLDEYLRKVKGILTEINKEKSESDRLEINELIKEADVIKNNITKETKRDIIIRLSKFFGKAQKVGLDVIKEIFIKIGTELVSKLVLGPH